MASVLMKDKKSSDFVLIPRGEYKKLLDLKKIFQKKLDEVEDTDYAVEVYLKEKKQKKLKTLKLLADLN